MNENSLPLSLSCDVYSMETERLSVATESILFHCIRFCYFILQSPVLYAVAKIATMPSIKFRIGRFFYLRTDCS